MWLWIFSSSEWSKEKLLNEELFLRLNMLIKKLSNEEIKNIIKENLKDITKEESLMYQSTQMCPV